MKILLLVSVIQSNNARKIQNGVPHFPGIPNELGHTQR